MASSSSSSPEITPLDYPHSPPRFSYKDATQQEVLDDLSSRFILNLPDEELALERVCFQVEQAHWFYEDFIREQHTKLPSLPLKKFSEMLFNACPLLQQWSHAHEGIYNNFMQYKTKVPVCGAIMLNDTMDKCVLVKGWKSSSGWGFPKGKINETEPETTCATREVLEETGYNIANQLEPENSIKFIMKDEQQVTLFVVFGVPEDYPFKTKTRKEISKIEWFKLSDLLTSKPKSSDPSASKPNKYGGRFYMITPFIVGELKKIIKRRKHADALRKSGKHRKNQVTIKAQPVTANLVPMQESVSQPPSMDKGGLESPSPQHITNPVFNSASEKAETDPHLARLLSSLTLSAVSSCENATHHKNKGAAVAPPSMRNAHAFEGSSVTRVPDPLSCPPTAPQTQSQPQDVPLGSNPIPSLCPLSNPQSSEENVAPIEQITLRSTRTATPLTSTSPSFSTCQTSRRLSSSADISPYLSRVSEIPTSAKRLQQLSLLESVADESARMAPIIAARAAMASRGSMPNGYPQPSPSVPPPQLVPNSGDLGILYSSYHPGPISANVQPPYSFDAAAHDPFQVRSRTSQAFHRAPMHNPTGSVNMSQNHLLAAINGSRLGPISPNFQAGPEFMQQQRPPQVFNRGPPFYGSSPHASYLPPPPAMNNVLPYSVPLAPISGPHPAINVTMPPGVNMASHNPTTMALLSILNGQPSHQPAFPA